MSHKQAINSNLTGGKVLGSGADGCVIDPVIPCKDDPDNNEKVSKLMTGSDANLKDIEMKIGKKLKKIDPKNFYFIYPEFVCKVKKNDIGWLEDEKLKCGHLLKDQIVYNLIMPRGDITLREAYRQHNFKTRETLKLILHLLYGCELLLKHELSHFDIKADNIVMVDDKDKFRPVMIDLGRFAISNLKEYRNLILATKDSYHWPMEVYFSMPSQRKNIVETIHNSLDKYIKKTSFQEFTDRVMVYLIGKMISGLDRSPDNTTDTLKKLYGDMGSENPWRRPTVRQCILRVRASLKRGNNTIHKDTTPQKLDIDAEKIKSVRKQD